MERSSGSAAWGARRVASTWGDLDAYCVIVNWAAAVVPPEETLKLSERISVGLRATLSALTSTGFGISFPEIWMSRPARVPLNVGLSAAPRARMFALIRPFTVAPGEKAIPAAAAKRAA